MQGREGEPSRVRRRAACPLAGVTHGRSQGHPSRSEIFKPVSSVKRSGASSRGQGEPKKTPSSRPTCDRAGVSEWPRSPGGEEAWF